ncbi:MAG: class I SAM-dependent methyltransferase family protein [Nanoarchaeota archaeon]|nr:class I SAM-dependent methyltransferase family protein [Nanoarchaeota archaeon]
MNLKELLEKKLTKKQIALLPTSYDMVGDLIIFSSFPEELLKKEKVIGQALLEMHKNAKVVLKKTKKYSGTFRVPKLKVLAGERRKETEHKENNVRLRLDAEKVYFSSRSSTERKRIFELVKSGESVLVMFSGCGPFVVEIARNSQAKEVYGVEINPIAHEYAVENVRLNKVDDKVKLYLGDVREVLPTIKKKFDRVLMPLPMGGEDFLELALTKVKKGGILHFYDFLNETEFDLAKDKIKKACKKRKFQILDVVKCGQFSPKV